MALGHRNCGRGGISTSRCGRSFAGSTRSGSRLFLVGHITRQNLFALKHGKSRATIVLTGHFDVVPADDYGALPAFDVRALLPATMARLKATGENPSALADFKSGEFLPGRGLLDMKAGLAAGIAACEAYVARPLCFFSLWPMKKTAPRVPALPCRTCCAGVVSMALNIELVINLDAISDQGDGAKAKVITYGSIGKQLLSAFIVGKEAHAGYPQDGVNAAYIAAELISAFEGNPAFVETCGRGSYRRPNDALRQGFERGLQRNHATQLSGPIGTRCSIKSLAPKCWHWPNSCTRGFGARRAAHGLCRAAFDFCRTCEHDVPDWANDAAVLRNRQTMIALDLPERAKRVTESLWRKSATGWPRSCSGFCSHSLSCSFDERRGPACAH